MANEGVEKLIEAVFGEGYTTTPLTNEKVIDLIESFEGRTQEVLRYRYLRVYNTHRAVANRILMPIPEVKERDEKAIKMMRHVSKKKKREALKGTLRKI